MKPFTMSMTGQLIFGDRTLDRLPSLLRGAPGSGVALISGRSFLKRPQWDELLESVEGQGRNAHCFTVTGEPSPESVDEIVSALRHEKIGDVVAMGGGSALDTGKAVSAMLCHPGSVADYLEGVGTQKPTGDKVPFIAVPTTAGTGSEASSNAVLCRRGENGFKKSLRHPRFVPDAALIDPSLTITCPRSVTAACGMDTFSQLVESFLSSSAHTLTDALAWSGIEAFLTSFLTVVLEEPENLEARHDLSYASYLSGVVLANSGLGAVHGIAGPLGGFYDIPHGVACANLLPGVMKVSLYGLLTDEPEHPALEKAARIGRLAAYNNDLGQDEAADFFLYLLDEWIDILKIPRLGDFGIDEKGLEKVIDASSNKQNPFHLSRGEIRTILTSRL